MSIASEITRLQNIKTNIRSALVTQGVPAASGHDMADFSADILSISAGGGATITVTYGSQFYNKTMTCTKGTTTYTETTTSSGSTVFNVDSSGTWTITCDGVSVNATVVLEYTTQMKPDGSTVTPTDDIQTWLKCAGIFNKNYTTIGQVLADSTTLLALISDNNAVDYMVRSTTWASSVCANSTAMTDIGANDYCATTLLGDSTWLNAICNSTYFESVLGVKVPTMTSNTTPSGECIAKSENAGCPAWQAFDNDSSTRWFSNDTWGSETWIGYIFPVSVTAYLLYLNMRAEVTSTTFKIQASNDGTVWTDLTGSTTVANGESKTPFTNSTEYTYYRILITAQTKSGTINFAGQVLDMQFYGR